MGETTLKIRLKNKYDTEANWKSKNPVLLKGELAFSSDKNNRYKVGDGSNKWSDLTYAKADLSKGDVTTALGYTPPTSNTWRGIQNNLTSDSTTDSLAAAQGKILKGLVDGKLPLSGGVMTGTAMISWPDSGNWNKNNANVTFPVTRGGLSWSGQSDGIQLYAVETGHDNLELYLKFSDDNSNGLSIRNKDNAQTARISATGIITASSFVGNLTGTASAAPWSGITGKPTSYPPSSHTHAYLPLAGGTMTGVIKRSGSGQWIKDRDNVAVLGTSTLKDAYNPVVGQLTPSGCWTIGNLASNEFLYFSYTTNANYNAGTNENINVSLPNQSGTIITSATIANQSVANSVTSKYLYITADNEIRFVKPSWTKKQNLWFGWAWNDGSKSELISSYSFGNGNGSLTQVNASQFNGPLNGNASTATALTTSAGSATQPIYFASGKPVACTYSLGKSVPSNAEFTDAKVTQTAVTSSGYTNWRTIPWGVSNSGAEGFTPTSVTGSLFVNENLTYQPSSGTLRAKIFKGDLSGTASKATLLAPAYTADTFSTASSTWRNGVTEGKVVWGQSWRDTSMSNDTGDLTIWIKQNKSATTANMTIDGTINAMGGFIGSLSGNASSATALTSSAGSATQPIYFSGGKPVVCTYTLAKSVPADAKFTDTNTWRGIQNNLTSTATDQSLAAAQGKTLNEKKMGAVSANGFYGMARPDGNTSDWIRTTNNGIIPTQSGSRGSGHSALGTSSWYFSSSYIDHMYSTDVKIADKVLLQYDSTNACLNFVFS